MIDDYNNDFYLQQQMNHDDVDPDQALKSGCFVSVFYLGAIIVAFLLCALFGSCKSVEYVTVPPQVHTDTLRIIQHEHDSIYQHDSIFVQQNGDTLTIEKWHTKYVESIKHDTTYISKTDSVPKPYPVTEYVEKDLTWWQQTRIHIGGIVLFLALIFVVAKWGVPLIKKLF